MAECDWDFGDCCPATCEAVDWFQPYDCGIAGYDCLDPGAPVLPPTGTVSRTVSPQPSSAPAPTIEVYGNPNFGYSMASGTYSASSTATLFGDAVYYNEFYMLYWCGDTLQWTIQLITDIGKIALYGCQGQGLSSLENTEPVSLCDTKWENTEGLVLLVVTTEDCPLDPSPPVIPGADFDVVGNGYTYGDDISGNYVASANSVFGVGVFYNGDFILYWCEPTSQWYLGSVDSIGTIESIRLFGCSGIMQSNPVSGPEVSICDVTWDDLIIFTTGCEKPDPPAPAIPGPDVQVIGSPSSGLFEFSGTYSGSSTDSISGVSIYYSDWSVIYWCEDTSQWYLYWIVSVDTIQNFGCEGWPSNPISGDPELLCEANWEDEFGNPSLLLSSMGSDDCPSYIPVPSTTGTAASFDLVVDFFGIPSVCAGIYIELEAVTAAGGLIFSNGACIFYQRFDDRWDWATILDLGAVQSLGVVESPIDSGFLQSDYPCGAGFQSALFCSPDCNSPWTAITPSVTFDVASLGQFEQSATLINGASVWFNCFGHFELYTDSYYSFWIFVAKAGFEVIFSDFVSSTDFCEANWYGIIEITSCPAGDFDFGISSASPMPSATVMPTTTPISTTTPVPSDATTTNSPTTDETTSFSSSFPSSFPTSFPSSFPSSVPPTV